jgi:hypothetical protein
MSADAEHVQKGKRVLVLWLCFVVLAVFLIAAGVVVGR